MVYGLCVAVFCVAGCNGHKPETKTSPIWVDPDVQRVLAWLPEDSETLLVARGPFWISDFQITRQEYQNLEVNSEWLEKRFESLTVQRFNFANSTLEKHLEGKKVLLAVEGSRHFRPPADVGEMPYEGCAIAIFADDLGDRVDAFTKDAASVVQQTEIIEGQKVAVFREQFKRDTWTTFVAFPQKDVALVASNRNFLQEVLGRMRKASAERAFPNSLPEWKYANTRAQFWGLRHFDKHQKELDPTSPFGDEKPDNVPDEKAIGLTYQCDPNKEKKVILTYLSGNKSGIRKIEQNRFPSFSGREDTARLHIQYQELAPGAIQSTYDVSQTRPFLWFLFVLMMNLGHGVYP